MSSPRLIFKWKPSIPVKFKASDLPQPWPPLAWRFSPNMLGCPSVSFGFIPPRPTWTYITWGPRTVNSPVLTWPRFPRPNLCSVHPRPPAPTRRTRSRWGPTGRLRFVSFLMTIDEPAHQKSDHIKFPLQPQQKYYITQHGELGFS